MKTTEVLQAMFTENTGRHILDSGGAYGRHWEQNQGLDMTEQPKAWHSYGPTLSTFHYLNDRLEFAPAMDRLFNIVMHDSDEPWLQDMLEFANKMDDSPMYRDSRNGWNSYNDETLLDQVIQWEEFDYKDEHYILLQVHGGCDVRGGYTKPRVFTATYDWYYQVADAIYHCTSGKWIPTGEYELGEVDVMGSLIEMPVMQWKRCNFGFSVYGPDVVDSDGSSTDLKDMGIKEDMWDSEIRCPDCGEPLEVDAPWPY